MSEMTLGRACEILNVHEHRGMRWEADVDHEEACGTFGLTEVALTRFEAVATAERLERAAVDTTPTAPPIDVRSQILALAELKDGWLDGEGKAYDPAALARVAATVGRLAAIGTAAVYPSPDGRVRLEWGERPCDDSLTIDTATGAMGFHLYDHETHKEWMGVVRPDGTEAELDAKVD